jgi:hypothetical protein
MDSSPPGLDDGRHFRESLQREQECLFTVAALVHGESQPPEFAGEPWAAVELDGQEPVSVWIT